ncbi:MAG: methylenetetrahydrofolate reductase C-terminal domain-containing protein [Coriobacteriia bacterium]|nr:methylenetetrahydrofolate reductase C-terminal domain-containing protein [Coriobacteriia bacterium]
MIITRPRDWERIEDNLASIGARSVFIMGCGQCATVAHTGGETEVAEVAARLEALGLEVTGWTVGEVTCHLGGTKRESRKHGGDIEAADAVLVLACGAGVQTVADSVTKPVFPGLESLFLGNVIRNGIFEERCLMCGECVLDKTAGICPVTTCPKGLLNGPCGGMWEGMCEVLTDRECTHVRIRRRLTEQHRAGKGTLAPKDFSKTLKPGGVNIRRQGGSR